MDLNLSDGLKFKLEFKFKVYIVIQKWITGTKILEVF